MLHITSVFLLDTRFFSWVWCRFINLFDTPKYCKYVSLCSCHSGFQLRSSNLLFSYAHKRRIEEFVLSDRHYELYNIIRAYSFFKGNTHSFMCFISLFIYYRWSFIDSVITQHIPILPNIRYTHKYAKLFSFEYIQESFYIIRLFIHVWNFQSSWVPLHLYVIENLGNKKTISSCNQMIAGSLWIDHFELVSP